MDIKSRPKFELRDTPGRNSVGRGFHSDSDGTGLENRKLGGLKRWGKRDPLPSLLIILNWGNACVGWAACAIKHFDQRGSCTEHLLEGWSQSPQGPSPVNGSYKAGPCSSRADSNSEKRFSGEALSFFKHSIMALQTQI